MSSSVRLALTRVAVSLSFASILASTPAHARSPVAKADDRVELIMSGLPPAGTSEYKTLLKIAGNATAQFLPLTSCEMWSVPRRRVSALQKAASEKNVSIRVLDESWNKVFTPMPSVAPMDDTSKSMRDMAMKSPSTGTVGMMSARAANMVEYALTKGINDKGSEKHPMTIKIALNDKTTVTAVRQSVAIDGNRCIWRGLVAGTSNPVTIMWWGTGRITGTIHHADRIYQLKQFSDDTIGIVESMTDKMPDEHARTSPQRMRDMKMQDDSIFKQGDSGGIRPRPKQGEVEDSKDAALASPTAGNRTAAIAPKPVALGERKSPAAAKTKAPEAVIDVMVVYTAKAAQHYGDIGRDLIELSIEETNQSFRASKVGNVKVRLVHTHQTDYVEDGAEHFNHVWRMVDKDGFMDEIPKLRDEKKADVVILVVDDKSGCGLATRVAADADEAYAVVHHECAATTYSLAHEIGHIIGTRHDRSIDQNVTPFPYGHGYVSPDLKWRTMMSYKASCKGCPRLPVWSTPERIVTGAPAGDKMHNNAAVIRDYAARVAGFR